MDLKRDIHNVDADLPTRAERGIDFDELLHQHSYTPEELSELLDVGAHTIRCAAFDGQLHATIVSNDIISISRASALEWLMQRG